jgi:hypothetical protein
MPGTINHLVGKVVTVTVNGTPAKVTQGTCTRKAVKHKVTNSTGNGYQQLEAGVLSASGDCQCVFAATTPVLITPGTKPDLVVDFGTGPTATITALVEEVKDTWAADGDLGYTFTWDSDGSFTYA